MNPPKMPIHIGDYKRDTGHLRAAGHGAYLLLLFHHWSTGSLPDDDEQLAAIACMTKQEWKKAKPVMAKFFGPGWVHSRVVGDLADAKASYERRALAGKEGGKAKAMGKQRPSNATALLKQPLTFNQGRDKIGEAREGESSFTEGSKALTDAFWRAVGCTSPLDVSPEYAGVDWRAIGWEKAGWPPDLIEAETRRIGGGKPLTYYEKVFATAFAKRQAPLPIVEIRPAETLTVSAHVKPKSGITQAIDDLNRELAGFDGPAREPDELRGPESKAPARLLSHG